MIGLLEANKRVLYISVCAVAQWVEMPVNWPKIQIHYVTCTKKDYWTPWTMLVSCSLALICKLPKRSSVRLKKKLFSCNSKPLNHLYLFVKKTKIPSAPALRFLIDLMSHMHIKGFNQQWCLCELVHHNSR